MTDTLTVADLRGGDHAVVVRVGGDPVLRKRFLEMGFVKGTPLAMMGAAPLGDPLEVRIRGYLLALRRKEAAHITVRVLNAAPGVPSAVRSRAAGTDAG